MVIIAKDANDIPQFLLVDSNNYLQTVISASLPAGSATIGKVDLNAPTTPYQGNVTVTTAGTRVVLGSSQAILGVTVKANDDNTGSIWIGDSSVASGDGLELSPGDGVPIDMSNINVLYIDSDEDGDGVSYLAVG